ncbi:hypothetical protein CC86DRAFT_207051 [Ophiobolus disseminans]|uniref:Uncharacterized protein n=1 Tax=Ophiobolus disseminans TaxID=1469910 RepID=A0A6A7A638_9PLEO|nr:hypothetical protein CC86DRAFT_207051 [Ophiobolus disseminans]
MSVSLIQYFACLAAAKDLEELLIENVLFTTDPDMQVGTLGTDINETNAAAVTMKQDITWLRILDCQFEAPCTAPKLIPLHPRQHLFSLTAAEKELLLPPRPLSPEPSHRHRRRTRLRSIADVSSYSMAHLLDCYRHCCTNGARREASLAEACRVRACP